MIKQIQRLRHEKGCLEVLPKSFIDGLPNLCIDVGDVEATSEPQVIWGLLLI